MALLGAIICQAIVHHYGRDEFLQRLSHPFWFQSFGAVMGMDWHSSGITTSVIGALKRGLAPLQGGIHVCGGRGRLFGETLIFAGDAMRSERAQKIELGMSGIFSTAIGKIDDFALGRPVDGAVRLVHEALETLGMPMVAPGLALVAVHALLHHPSICRRR